VIEFDGTYINSHNFSLLCDRMTFTSKMISIFRHGINNDNIGPIAKASFEETPEIFLRAAKHGELDIMRGVSANVMCGQEGLFGTNAFQVVLDMAKMRSVRAEEERDKRVIDIPLSKSSGCDPENIIIDNDVSFIQPEPETTSGSNDTFLSYVADF
jgi:hypothetical protein